MSTTEGHIDTGEPDADWAADAPAGPTDDDADAPPAPSGLAAARLRLAEIGSGVAPLGQPPRLVLLGIVALWFVTFSVLVVWRHDRYGSFDFDLGIWDQSAWLLAHNGGFNTVRSFEQSQLGPKSATSGDPLGGEFRNVINAELRFPILSLLEGAVFADAGNVGLRVEEFSLSDLSYGIGGGLRLDLPIGPVRLDAAWNPDPGPSERDYSLHFSVGFPF